MASRVNTVLRVKQREDVWKEVTETHQTIVGIWGQNPRNEQKDKL